MDLSQFDLLALSLGAFAFGVFLLIKGGDWTVDSASAIASRFGLSPLIIGFTIVAFGTSLPEMVVTVNAHLKDMSDIAFGGVIGSNISNILLILGASALITPLAVSLRESRADMAMMLLASVVIYALLFLAVIPQWAGLAMIVALVGYSWFRIHTSRGSDDKNNVSDSHHSLMPVVVLLIGGLVFLALGAEFLVRGAGTAARILGVPELVIGLTLVAFGTSAPELAACIAAALKKQPGMIVGNIIGSNVFNILSILGVTILVKSVVVSDISPDLMARDMPVMLAATIGLIALIALFKGVPRLAGIAMVGLYAAYIAALAL